MPKIFLIDDHPILREGLVVLLERQTGFEICGQAGTAAEALERIPEAQPDLVLLDLTLPDQSGLELIKDLRALSPELSILVLSMHDETLYAERVIRAGASGYIMKEAAAEYLVDAIHQVLTGGIALSRDAASQILGSLSKTNGTQVRSHLHCLTDREFEVFELIGQGHDVHAISQRLGISPRTVDAHRAHIRDKLDLPDSVALMRYAVRWSESGSAMPED